MKKPVSEYSKRIHAKKVAAAGGGGLMLVALAEMVVGHIVESLVTRYPDAPLDWQAIELGAVSLVVGLGLAVLERARDKSQFQWPSWLDKVK